MAHTTHATTNNCSDTADGKTITRNVTGSIIIAAAEANSRAFDERGENCRR